MSSTQLGTNMRIPLVILSSFTENCFKKETAHIFLKHRQKIKHRQKPHGLQDLTGTEPLEPDLTEIIQADEIIWSNRDSSLTQNFGFGEQNWLQFQVAFLGDDFPFYYSLFKRFLKALQEVIWKINFLLFGEGGSHAFQKLIHIFLIANVLTQNLDGSTPKHQSAFLSQIQTISNHFPPHEPKKFKKWMILKMHLKRTWLCETWGKYIPNLAVLRLSKRSLRQPTKRKQV